MTLFESWFEDEYRKKTGNEIHLPGHPERRQLIWKCGCGVNRSMIQGICYACGKMSNGDNIED